MLFANAEAFTQSTPYVSWREILRDMLDRTWEADDRSVVRRLYEVDRVAGDLRVVCLDVVA